MRVETEAKHDIRRNALLFLLLLLLFCVVSDVIESSRWRCVDCWPNSSPAVERVSSVTPSVFPPQFTFCFSPFNHLLLSHQKVPASSSQRASRSIDDPVQLVIDRHWRRVVVTFVDCIGDSIREARREERHPRN